MSTEPELTDTHADNEQLARVATEQLLTIERPDPAVEALRIEQLRSSYAVIALALGVVGLIGALFVGWMVPLSMGAIIFSLMSRRGREWSPLTVIALTLGCVGVLYSALWIVYYVTSFAD